MNLGVLISGNGSNLGAILDAIAEKRLDARVAVVLSNMAGAGGLARASKAGVPRVVLSHRDFEGRAAFDAEVVRVLREHDVDLVVLAGFMRIVTSVLLDAFPSRVVNIHPALLPSFAGTHGQRDALAYGVRISGCTVHLVDTGTDTGPILAQAAVAVAPDDDEAALRQRILAREHELLPTVLQWFAEGRVDVEPSPGARSRVIVRGVRTAFGLAIE